MTLVHYRPRVLPASCPTIPPFFPVSPTKIVPVFIEYAGPRDSLGLAPYARQWHVPVGIESDVCFEAETACHWSCIAENENRSAW